MVGCWCCAGSSLIPGKAKSQVVIPHTRPWLSLLAELYDTSPGTLDAHAGLWILPAGSTQQRCPLGVVRHRSDLRGRVMNHINLGDASTWRAAPLILSTYSDTVAGFPQTVRHRDMC